MNWATAIQQPVVSAPQVSQACEVAAGTTAVLDASAIISGFSRAVADHLATIPAVLAECKDAVAKQRLQLLPGGISVVQPSTESIRIGPLALTLQVYHTQRTPNAHLVQAVVCFCVQFRALQSS